MKKKVYRNTAAFKLLAWGSFALFVILILIGLYTLKDDGLKEPLMVKGYYLMGTVGVISSAFTIAKVTRDDQEDDERYNEMFRAVKQEQE